MHRPCSAMSEVSTRRERKVEKEERKIEGGVERIYTSFISTIIWSPLYRKMRDMFLVLSPNSSKA